MKKLFGWMIVALFLSGAYGFTPSGDLKTEANTAKIGLGIGDEAPDLAFESPDGKILKLSELRGNVVLIDFWASWCGPCRRENPNIVSAYQKYKKAKFKNAKGFEIFSVSLDKDKTRWLGAIEKDKLSWKNHVSDLKGWQSAAAGKYGVRSIPTSFLIDADGIIVAKGPALRGMGLHKSIDALVKSLN